MGEDIAEHAPARPAGARVPPPPDLARSRRKRAFDLVMVVATLPVTLPLGLLIGLLVRLTSRGPAVFHQERMGTHGEPFRMHKFRSMVVDAEERLASDPALWDLYVRSGYKIPDRLDPRVTRVGRFLRVTSLDELPQLINVLDGTMSLVGPRPVTRAQYDAVVDDLDAYRAARPGMTGYWQVEGRSTIVYPARAAYDDHYVRNWSLRRDLALLARTAHAVLRRDGAY